MFEDLGFETLTAPQASIWFGLGLGLAFGVLAEVTRFCLRRAVVGPDRSQAGGVWLAALAVALFGTQGAVALDLISFDAHRFLSPDLPIVAIALGGLMFGAGMVLTRGCISRLTVLGASGNLRAVLVLLVVAVVAHAAAKGVLAPLRTGISDITVTLDWGLWAIPQLGFVLAALAALVALRSGASIPSLLGGAAIGALVPLGWVGTGFVLYDDFDPIAHASLGFTGPLSDSLFWTIASTAVPANFGVGLIGGTLVGAALSALISGRFGWVSFDGATQTGRYIGGGSLMGLGGVLAGGCTVGAGLAGVPTLGTAVILTLVFILLGALATHVVLSRRSLPLLTPAE